MSAGSSSGTFIAANPQSFTGDFIRFQLNGSNVFVVDYAGSTTIAGNLTVSTTTASSTIAHSFIVDTNTLVVNANENRVGIGAAVPSSTLSVVGNTILNGTLTAAGNTAITGGAFTLYPSANASNIFRIQDAS